MSGPKKAKQNYSTPLIWSQNAIIPFVYNQNLLLLDNFYLWLLTTMASNNQTEEIRTAVVM